MRADVRVFRDAAFFGAGTFAPASRASLKPMAIACFRLVTRRPDPPDRKVPRARSRIARATFVAAWRAKGRHT